MTDEERKKLITRRRMLELGFKGFAGAALATPLLAAGCGTSDEPTSQTGGSGGQEQVHFILDFTPKGYHAPFYLTLDKGMWADKGLSVALARGYGSADTAVRVGRGEGDFGFAGVSAVMATIAGGLPLTEFGPLLHTHPVTVYSLDDLSSGDDLVGKVGANDLKSEADQLMRAYCASEGIDYENDIEWIYRAEAGLPDVQTGKADFVLDWIANIPEWWQQDLEPSVAPWIGKELGLYGNGFIARPDLLTEKRDTAKRFLEGIYEGYLYVMDGGEEAQNEAVDALFKYEPDVAAQPGAHEFHLGVLQMMIGLIVSDEDAQQHGINYWEPGKVDKTLTFINEYLLEEPLEREPTFLVEDQLTEDGQYMVEDVDATLKSVSMVSGRRNPLLG